MTSTLWTQAVQRLFSICFTLRVWLAGALFAPLSRLLHWPTSRSAETSPQTDLEVNDPKAQRGGKVETIVRDAQGQFISGGLTGIVELVDECTVLKSPFPGPELEDHILDIEKEAKIYNRVGPHARLVKVLGHSRDGLRLEYMRNGDLKTYLQSRTSIPKELKLKWAYQIAESIALMHKHRVIHCDIKPRNFLLDDNLKIKIIDFSGSSLDGSKPASGEGTRFYLPRHWRDPPTIATDLFALGSTLYEVFEEKSPYAEVPSDQVELLFKNQKFPNVSHLQCGHIIKQCWLSEVHSADIVQQLIHQLIPQEVNDDYTPRRDGQGTARGT